MIRGDVMIHFDNEPTFEAEIKRRLHSGGCQEYFVFRPKPKGDIGDVSIFLSREQLRTIRDSINDTLHFWDSEGE